MAIIDNLLKLDDGATVTGGTTTQGVGVIDLKNQSAARKLGTGRRLWAVFHITGNTGGDGSDTLAFGVQTAATIAGNTLQSPTTVAISPTVTGVANLPAGSRVVVALPPGVAFQRYVAAVYAVTATAVLTVTAYLTDQDPSDLSVYPDAI